MSALVSTGNPGTARVSNRCAVSRALLRINDHGDLDRATHYRPHRRSAANTGNAPSLPTEMAVLDVGRSTASLQSAGKTSRTLREAFASFSARAYGPAEAQRLGRGGVRCQSAGQRAR